MLRSAPCRAALSRAATSTSVCASTALVGSTSTRTSLSASRARARASRCALAAGEAAAGLVDLRVEAVGQGLEHVAGRGDVAGRSSSAASSAVSAPRVELVAQRCR